MTQNKKCNLDYAEKLFGECITDFVGIFTFYFNFKTLEFYSYSSASILNQNSFSCLTFC